MWSLSVNIQCLGRPNCMSWKIARGLYWYIRAQRRLRVVNNKTQDKLIHCVTIIIFFVMCMKVVVGIVTRLWAGWSGIWILVDAGDFSLLWNVQVSSRANIVFCLVSTAFLSWDKATSVWSYSPPSSAAVKNEWSYTSVPHIYIYMLLWLGQEELTFPFFFNTYGVQRWDGVGLDHHWIAGTQ